MKIVILSAAGILFAITGAFLLVAAFGPVINSGFAEVHFQSAQWPTRRTWFTLAVALVCLAVGIGCSRVSQIKR